MECMFIFKKRLFKSSFRLRIQSFLEDFDCLARLEQNLMITERHFSNITKEIPFRWKAKTRACGNCIVHYDFLKNQTDNKNSLTLSFMGSFLLGFQIYFLTDYSS